MNSLSLNKQRNGKYRTLCYLAKHGEKEAFEACLSSCSPEIRPKYWEIENLFDIACGNKHVNIMSYLVDEWDVSISKKRSKILLKAEIDKDARLLCFLLEYDSTSNPVLPESFMWWDIDVYSLECFIKHGLDVNRNNAELLWFCTTYNKYDQVEFLLTHDADVHANDEIALYETIRWPKPRMMHLLLKHGANIYANSHQILDTIIKEFSTLDYSRDFWMARYECFRLALMYYSANQLDAFCNDDEIRKLEVGSVICEAARTDFDNVALVWSVLATFVLDRDELTSKNKESCIEKHSPLPLVILQCITLRKCEVDVVELSKQWKEE